MMSALVGRGRQNYNPEASTARRYAPGGALSLTKKITKQSNHEAAAGQPPVPVTNHHRLTRTPLKYLASSRQLVTQIELADQQQQQADTPRA